jgi:hypothetical protein
MKSTPKRSTRPSPRNFDPATGSIDELAAELAEKHDHPPDKVKHRVEKLVSRGDIIDDSGGKQEDLRWKV